jgi:hypothetical protein
MDLCLPGPGGIDKALTRDSIIPVYTVMFKVVQPNIEVRPFGKHAPVDSAAEQTELCFRPLERTDFGLLQTWLEEPHVAQWWDDPHDPETSIRAFESAGFSYLRTVEVTGEADPERLMILNRPSAAEIPTELL